MDFKSYSLVMNRFVMTALLGMASASAFGQENSAAAQIAAQREAEERDRRTTIAIENLQTANNLMQRRINELKNEVDALRRQLSESDGRFKNSQIGAVNRQDLREVYDKMAEMERARDADKKLIIEQVHKLQELAARPPQQIVIQAPPPKPEVKQTPRPEPAAPVEPESEPEFVGEFYPYKIKSGDRLTSVIAAYNSELKDKGKAPITLDMVLKANPKLKPDKLMVGKEIRIPVPPDKK